ncbi:hypothetical protein PsorP6_011402 [Peronosclerospora sorghi]|uniref:Uncharacterized protein n=1 Tax=Peronosclerospora sorghi TaxID=230839 RepID=A0ACC0WK31_9STRA|nr:hypothetical protein PsorP6_011402 [Peronosclerospora sorghi]
MLWTLTSVNTVDDNQRYHASIDTAWWMNLPTAAPVTQWNTTRWRLPNTKYVSRQATRKNHAHAKQRASKVTTSTEGSLVRASVAVDADRDAVSLATDATGAAWCHESREVDLPEGSKVSGTAFEEVDCVYYLEGESPMVRLRLESPPAAAYNALKMPEMTFQSFLYDLKQGEIDQVCVIGHGTRPLP